MPPQLIYHTTKGWQPYSIVQLIDTEGNLIEETNYGHWGRYRDPNTWVYDNTASLNMIHRGYTGHEMLNNFDLIHMNGRMYDPVLARVLSPDNYVQNPTNLQNYNRYAYCYNNPLKYTDPDGEFVQYIIGGIVGGLSGYVGGTIATSEIPMANTLGIAGASLTNSIGTNIYTGGQTPVSVSFGVASYNFDNNEWGYLGKKGNSTLENIGYGFGALANLADINQVINSTQATLYTDESDFISHSAIVDKNTGDPLMSFCPNDTKVPNTKLGYATYFRRSTSDFHYNPTLPVDLTVNKYAIDVVRGLGKILPFQGITTNCVNMASLSLWLNGIPNIGLSPWILYGTTWAYTAGIRPDLYSYYFTQYGR